MSLRILLSEGTSLSAREAVTVLGRAGQTVEICAPQRLCFGGYSRWVDRVHVMPAVGADPAGYVEAVAGLCARERIDVLLPVHEQAYLFAALRRRDPVWPAARTAVPVAPLSAYEAVQTKRALALTLEQAGLPQPETLATSSAEELLRRGEALLQSDGACVVKSSSGTASVGLHRVRSHRHLEELCEGLAGRERLAGPAGEETEPVLIQRMVPGPLERLQAVFAAGKLVAIHCYRQLVEGLGGGDVVKESVSRPAAVAHMQELGARLGWHGALSFDYILESGKTACPRYIDANPRLVEPVNADLSGVDLAGALLRVALGLETGPLLTGREGVRTRLGIPGLIERASATGRRRAVVADFAAQLRKSGRYERSVEELTPWTDDARSAIPLLGVLLSLLVTPSSAAAINRATIESYALGPRGHGFVRELGS